MKSMLYGNYVVYQYEMDSEDHKTDKFFAIAIVLSEYLAKELCNDNDMRFYEEEEINIGEDVPAGVSMEKSTPIKFDQFEPSSHNGFMIGTKSAAKNYICEECGAFLGSSAHLYSLHMRQAHGQKTIIVDECGEYEKLAQEFGGEVIKLNPESAKSINVFELMSESNKEPK